MAKYIISIDSFMNQFSMIDADADITFTPIATVTPFDHVSVGDFILIYRKAPVSKITIVLEVVNGHKFKKLFEVHNGLDLATYLLGYDPETEEIHEINEDVYYQILGDLLHYSIPVPLEATTPTTPAAVGDGDNILFYGVPGSGKSTEISRVCTNPDYMKRVVFHPDYTFSDFIGQIMPQIDEVTGDVEYKFVEGPFTSILKTAEEHRDHMYYLVIEEINRGNAPAIFGDLFQLLDRDTTGTSVYGITNYDIAKEVYGDKNHLVRIPSNLTLLATMNTSDQNVFTLDTAFQRRWNMKHIPNKFNDAHADDRIDGSGISWGAFATTINEIIIEINSDFAGSGDKRLGAYFAKSNELSKERFPEKVLKYLWDDAFRMDKTPIFKESMTSLDIVLDTYKDSTTDPLREVLKEDVYNTMVDKMVPVATTTPTEPEEPTV